MTTMYIQICYYEVKKKAKGSHGFGDVWLENMDLNAKSFAGFVQSGFYKTATALESKALVPYHVYAFLLIILKERKMMADR